MYVRWKRYARKGEKRYERGVGFVAEGRTLWTVVLVESQRIGGKPRQRVVRYLGAMSDHQLCYPARRLDFWRSVERHLDDLGITGDDRGRIEARLAGVVPRPTADELASSAAEVGRLNHEIAVMKAGAGR